MRKILGAIHLLTGIGALFGGSAAILDPTGSSVGLLAQDALKNGPFETFLIPGLFLFFVIGGGNLFSLFLLIKKHHIYKLFGVASGLVLCMWIAIQCIVLQTINGLHVLFFALGLIMMILSFRLVETTKSKYV